MDEQEYQDLRRACDNHKPGWLCPRGTPSGGCCCTGWRGRSVRTSARSWPASRSASARAAPRAWRARCRRRARRPGGRARRRCCCLARGGRPRRRCCTTRSCACGPTPTLAALSVRGPRDFSCISNSPQRTQAGSTLVFPPSFRKIFTLPVLCGRVHVMVHSIGLYEKQRSALNSQLRCVLQGSWTSWSCPEPATSAALCWLAWFSWPTSTPKAWTPRTTCCTPCRSGIAVLYLLGAPTNTVLDACS